MSKTVASSPPQSPEKGADFYCAQGYRPEESMGYLMRQILNEVALQVEQELAHSDLTNAQWIPIYKLFMGKASTVAELARECQLDAGAMTRTLDRLEAKDLCQRVRSASDRRVVNITLTDAGRRAAAEIPHVLSRVQNTNLRGFTTAEFETLKGFLRRILANSQAVNHAQALTPTTTTGAPDAA